MRQRVGMFDVSHMGEIFVAGDDAEQFVNHIFTNDVTALPAGKILYGMMLYPDGGVVDDLLVYKMAEPKTWLLVVNAANIDKDDTWIREQAKDFNVEIDNASPRYRDRLRCKAPTQRRLPPRCWEWISTTWLSTLSRKRNGRETL